MLWGMVPFWHRGDVPTSHKLTTNNARLEGKKNSSTILEKSQFNEILYAGGTTLWHG